MERKYKAKIFEEVPGERGSIILKPVTTAKLLTVSQTASILGISPATLYRRIDLGLFPAERPSPGCIRIRLDDVLAYQACSRDPEFNQRPEARGQRPGVR